MSMEAETILKIAQLAEAIGRQAGVGGSETAGMIVSYLAAHPEQTDKVLAEGIFDLPDQWWAHGRLTWNGMNGRIVEPQDARFARIVRNMQKNEPRG